MMEPLTWEGLRRDRDLYGVLCAEALVAGNEVLARYYAAKCVEALRELAQPADEESAK